MAAKYDREAILRAIWSGQKYTAIAAEFGCDESLVSKIAISNGVKVKSKIESVFERTKCFWDERDSGLTVKEIAAKYGVSIQHVYRALYPARYLARRKEKVVGSGVFVSSFVTGESYELKLYE